MSVVLLCLPPSDQSVSPWRMRKTRAGMLGLAGAGFELYARSESKMDWACGWSHHGFSAAGQGHVLLNAEVSTME
jgi:hypothetical protein